jgi:hypothetical protein
VTIDLKEHMTKKTKDKHIKAYNDIGKAVDGMTIGTVLHILASFSSAVLGNMEEPDRTKAAMVFSSIIMSNPTDEKETVQ